MPKFCVIDVESIGLHGEAYAVGWVVVDEWGHECENGIQACPPEAAWGSEEGRAWVRENAPPIKPTAPTPAQMRESFWGHWERMQATWKGVQMVADCQWPVEARFLLACVDDAPGDRCWRGPYPLHEVATMRLAAGLDPVDTDVWRDQKEFPQHDPLADARQSARQFVEAWQAASGGVEEQPEPALTQVIP